MRASVQSVSGATNPWLGRSGSLLAEPDAQEASTAASSGAIPASRASLLVPSQPRLDPRRAGAVSNAMPPTVTLTGATLTCDDIIAVARGDANHLTPFALPH